MGTQIEGEAENGGARSPSSELSLLPRLPQLACGVLWLSGYGHIWLQNATDLILSSLTILKQLAPTVSKLWGALGWGDELGASGPPSPTPEWASLSSGDASKPLKFFCLPLTSDPGDAFQSLSFVTLGTDKNSAPTATLTCLFNVPQAWLGAGTSGVPSLLLVSLSVGLVLVSTLVRCPLPQPQRFPPLALRSCFSPAPI